MQRTDGRWMGRVELPERDSTTGRRRRKYVYGSTRSAVSDQVNVLLGRASTGDLGATSSPTLGPWLEQWYATKLRTGGRGKKPWSIGTRKAYADIIGTDIGTDDETAKTRRTPATDGQFKALATVRLEALTADRVQRWVNGFGTRTIARCALLVLRQAIDLGKKQCGLTHNVARSAELPMLTPRKPNPLSRDQARTLRTVIDTSTERLAILVLLALVTGMRIGELLGLSWAQIDFDTRTIQVSQQLQWYTKKWGSARIVPVKTKHGNRLIKIPKFLIDALKRQRKQQNEERLRAGASWTHAFDLIFTDETGGPLRQPRVNTAFLRLLAAADIAVTNFHCLRHTCAVLLLEQREPIERVSRLLGHSSIKVTMDVYGDWTTKMQESVADTMEQIYAQS